MSDAEGLARYGIEPKTVVRQPTRDRIERMAICAECGTPIGGMLGPQRIHHPDVLPADFAEQPAVLPCYGWQCEHHPYEVVMPLRAANNRSPDDGWTGVRVKLADGRVCQIAVPEREVSERVE